MSCGAWSRAAISVPSATARGRSWARAGTRPSSSGAPCRFATARATATRLRGTSCCVPPASVSLRARMALTRTRGKNARQSPDHPEFEGARSSRARGASSDGVHARRQPAPRARRPCTWACSRTGRLQARAHQRQGRRRRRHARVQRRLRVEALALRLGEHVLELRGRLLLLADALAPRLAVRGGEEHGPTLIRRRRPRLELRVLHAPIVSVPSA